VAAQDPPASVDTSADTDSTGTEDSTEGLLTRILPLVEMNSRDRWIELLAATLLAIAAISSAWSAYESGRWGGVQATAFSEAAGLRDQANAERATGDQLVSIDAGIFTQWAAAFAGADDSIENPNEDDELTSFLFGLMRDEFRPAMDAWIALEPVKTEGAPKSPFEMPEYSLSQYANAETLMEQSTAKGQEARNANQTSDDYVLSTVLFASVLFFAGISAKFKSRRVRVFMLAVGILVLVFAAGRVATLPFT